MFKVKKKFTDRDSGVTYEVGDPYSGTETRVAELQEGGYLTKTEVVVPTEPEEPAPTPARKK